MKCQSAFLFIVILSGCAYDHGDGDECRLGCRYPESREPREETPSERHNRENSERRRERITRERIEKRGYFQESPPFPEKCTDGGAYPNYINQVIPVQQSYPTPEANREDFNSTDCYQQKRIIFRMSSRNNYRKKEVSGSLSPLYPPMLLPGDNSTVLKSVSIEN